MQKHLHRFLMKGLLSLLVLAGVVNLAKAQSYTATLSGTAPNQTLLIAATGAGTTLTIDISIPGLDFALAGGTFTNNSSNSISFSNFDISRIDIVHDGIMAGSQHDVQIRFIGSNQSAPHINVKPATVGGLRAHSVVFNPTVGASGLSFAANNGCDIEAQYAVSLIEGAFTFTPGIGGFRVRSERFDLRSLSRLTIEGSGIFDVQVENAAPHLSTDPLLMINGRVNVALGDVTLVSRMRTNQSNSTALLMGGTEFFAAGAGNTNIVGEILTDNPALTNNHGIVIDSKSVGMSGGTLRGIAGSGPNGIGILLKGPAQLSSFVAAPFLVEAGALGDATNTNPRGGLEIETNASLIFGTSPGTLRVAAFGDTRPSILMGSIGVGAGIFAELPIAVEKGNAEKLDIEIGSFSRLFITDFNLVLDRIVGAASPRLGYVFNTASISPATARNILIDNTVTPQLTGDFVLNPILIERTEAPFDEAQTTLRIGGGLTADIIVNNSFAVNKQAEQVNNIELIAGGDIVLNSAISVSGTLLLDAGNMAGKAIRPRTSNIINAENVTLGTNDNIVFRLADVSVQSSDRLSVSRNINLNNANLLLTNFGGVAVPQPGQTITLISLNDPTATVTGTFNGLPQNSVISDAFPGLDAFISYTGGDGNDVTLTFIDPTAPLGTLVAFNSIYGTPSATQTLLVQAAGYTNPVTVSVPAGFEIALSSTGTYASDVTIPVASLPASVFVRLRGNVAAGVYNGLVSATSTGAATQTVVIPNSTVAPRELTVNISASNKVYDATTNATVNLGTPQLLGIVGSDVVSLSGTPGFAFADANVGTGKAINITGAYTLTGAAAANYTLAPIALTADITSRALSITGLTADNKVYDATAAATLSGTAALSGVPAADLANVSLTGAATGVFASANAGTHNVTISGLSLTGVAAGNYTLTLPVLSAQISRRALSITGLSASDKEYDRTTAATLTGTAALNGVLPADAANINLAGTATGTFASANAGTHNVNVTGLSITGTATGNYTLTALVLSATINAKALTVSGLNAANKIADGNTTATITGTPVLSGVIAGDVVTLSGTAAGAFSDAAEGTGKTVTVTGLTLGGAQSANYTLAAITLTADILPAASPAPTLTAPAPGSIVAFTGTIGTPGTTQSFTLTGSGVINDVTITAPAGFQIATSPGGPFGGSLTVAPGSLPVTIYLQLDPALLPGNYSGNIVVSSIGAASINIAIPASSVQPRILSISGLTANNKVYDGNNIATASGTPVLNGVLSGDVVNLAGSPVFTFSNAQVGNSKTVSASGYTLTGANANKYQLEQPSLTANITPRALTVSGLTANNKVYDGNTSATVSGTAVPVNAITGDVVNISGTVSASFSSASVANNIAVNVSGLSLSGADAANYTLTQPVLSADITPKALTLSGLSAANKVYDRTNVATLSGTAQVNGLVGADVVTLAGTASALFNNAAVGTNKPVTVSGLSLSGADAANYSLALPVLSANITPRSVSITGLAASNKNFDGNTNAVITGIPVLQGVLSGDVVNVAGTPTGTFDTPNVGNNKPVTVSGLSLSGADAANYELAALVLSANILSVQTTPVQPPSAPLQLQGTPGSQQVLLTWIAGNQPAGVRYEIFGFGSSQLNTRFGETTATSFVVTGLNNGELYLFRVRAIGLDGQVSAFSNSVTVRPSIVLSTEELNIADASVQVYPNPNAGTFFIALPKASSKALQIRISDMSGREVHQEVLNPGAVQYQVETNLLSAGSYLLMIGEGKDLQTHKIMITK